MSGKSVQTIRVWDLPTRVFHWSLVLCMVGLVITGKIGGAAMIWHSRLGYAVGTLLLFRVAWGLVGGHWSRFRSFVYAPGVLAEYVRGRAARSHTIGHTPLGALSVFALLVFLTAQFATGLFSDDTAAFYGPLNILVSSDTASLLTRYHKDIGEVVLIVLVLLHVAAIAYYHLRRGENLIGPMWHGDKALNFSAPSSRDDARARVLALVLLGLCSAAITGLVYLGGE